MHSKNNPVITMTVIGALVLTTVASLGFYLSRPQSTASANAAVQQVSPQQDTRVVAPEAQIASQDKGVDALAPQAASKVVLSQTKQDVTVEVTYAKIIETGVEIGICYTTLDDAEWYPQPGHLFYGQYEVFPDEFGFTTEEKADGKKFGKRCAMVRYRIDDLASITTPIQFSITNVIAVPSEWMSLCVNLQQRLDTNLKAKAEGLTAKCAEASDGSAVVTLVDNDKSVTKEKAKRTLDDIAKGVVTGPWDFTITEFTK